MKKIISAIILLLACLNGAAQSGRSGRSFHVGVHTGLDIGAAVPWPLSKAVGGGDKMNVTPRLSPALGLSFEKMMNSCWSVVAEGTYKTVAMDAEIITLRNGQRFKDENDLDVLFFGRANTSMSFTQLEMPLYVKYRFNERNRAFLGGYYSRIFSGKFEASALDGRLQNPDDPNDIVIVHPSDPAYQNFSENIDVWDAGFIVGYERKIFRNTTLSGRFSTGFKDIFKPNENYLDYSMWNMRGTVTLSYRLL